MMPVSATMMIPVFGPGRSRVASVSTGLPQPSPQAALIEVTMATMTPMAERCAPGRKLNRPLLTGVRSPSAAAMSACAQLCRISASTNATNVSIMANGLAISPNNRMLLPGRYLRSLCAPRLIGSLGGFSGLGLLGFLLLFGWGTLLFAHVCPPLLWRQTSCAATARGRRFPCEPSPRLPLYVRANARVQINSGLMRRAGVQVGQISASRNPESLLATPASAASGSGAPSVTGGSSWTCSRSITALRSLSAQ